MHNLNYIKASWGILLFILILWFQHRYLFLGQLIYRRASCHLNCFSFETNLAGGSSPHGAHSAHGLSASFPRGAPSSLHQGGFTGTGPEWAQRAPHSVGLSRGRVLSCHCLKFLIYSSNLCFVREVWGDKGTYTAAEASHAACPLFPKPHSGSLWCLRAQNRSRPTIWGFRDSK